MGKSGSGKSNIFDGLTWVLFDKTARKNYDKKNVIRDVPDKATQAIGEVVFSEGDDVFEITRMRGERDALIIIKNGQALELRNPTYAQEELESILGLDFSTFVNIAYFSQGDTGKFLSSTSADRIKVISSVLGLADYDRAAKIAGDKAKALSLQIEGELGQAKTFEKIVGETDFKALNRSRRVAQAELTKVLEELTVKSKYLNVLRNKATEKSAIQSQSREYSSEKDALKNFIDKTKGRIAEAERELRTEDKVKKELSELKETLEEIVIIEKSLESQEAVVVSLRGGQSALKIKFDSNMERASEIEGAQVSIGDSCPTCHSEITADTKSHIKTEAKRYRDKAVKINNTITRQKKELDKANLEVDRLDKELLKHRKVQLRRDNLMDRLVGFGKIRDQVNKLKSDLEVDTEDTRAKLKDRKAAYDIRLKEYKSTFAKHDLEKLDEYEKRVVQLSADEVTHSASLSTIKYSIEQYQKAINGLGELKKKIAESESEIDKADYWKQAFPKLKLQVISESIPMVEAMTNEYLSELIEGVTIEMDVDPIKATNRLPIFIRYDDGTKRIYEGWNGGAQLQMSMANFMALNKLASLRSGKRVNFLLLDEKFASVDTEARADILELLRNTYTDRKLFAISHVEGIEPEFDQVIRIKSNNRVSEIDCD